MPPIIHCVHHVKNQHNSGVNLRRTIDSDLTALGERQCCDLPLKKFPNKSPVSLATAFPHSRTLQRAFLAIQTALQNGIRHLTIIKLYGA